MRTSKWAAIVTLVIASACIPDDGRVMPRVGNPAVEYPAATLAGDTVTLASLRGQVVLLNLWATWCVPCRTETPYLEQLSVEYLDRGLQVVGISLDTGDAADQVEMFVEEFGVTYTILHDPQMRGMDLYQVPGLPATFLIDREGILRWIRYGPILEGDTNFLGALEELLS
jgi:cytochrome c-type biogenesis protein